MFRSKEEKEERKKLKEELDQLTKECSELSATIYVFKRQVVSPPTAITQQFLDLPFLESEIHNLQERIEKLKTKINWL